MIKCSNKQCGAIICVKFHRDLSPQSCVKLATKYRSMLATSHCDKCPFKMDAVRWLLKSTPTSPIQSGLTKNIHNDDAKDTLQFRVPPFLLQMSTEYAILEDLSHTGFITRNYLRQQASELEQQMNLILSNYDKNQSYKWDFLSKGITSDINKQIHHAAHGQDNKDSGSYHCNTGPGTLVQLLTCDDSDVKNSDCKNNNNEKSKLSDKFFNVPT